MHGTQPSRAPHSGVVAHVDAVSLTPATLKETSHDDLARHRYRRHVHRRCALRRRERCHCESQGAHHAPRPRARHCRSRGHCAGQRRGAFCRHRVGVALNHVGYQCTRRRSWRSRRTRVHWVRRWRCRARRSGGGVTRRSVDPYCWRPQPTRRFACVARHGRTRARGRCDCSYGHGLRSHSTVRHS